jgi:hypothetical protein
MDALFEVMIGNKISLYSFRDLKLDILEGFATQW